MKIYELSIEGNPLVSDEKYAVVLAEDEETAKQTFREAYCRETGNKFTGKIEANEKCGVLLEGFIGF